MRATPLSNRVCSTPFRRATGHGKSLPFADKVTVRSISPSGAIDECVPPHKGLSRGVQGGGIRLLSRSNIFPSLALICRRSGGRLANESSAPACTRLPCTEGARSPSNLLRMRGACGSWRQSGVEVDARSRSGQKGGDIFMGRSACPGTSSEPRQIVLHWGQAQCASCGPRGRSAPKLPGDGAKPIAGAPRDRPPTNRVSTRRSAAMRTGSGARHQGRDPDTSPNMASTHARLILGGTPNRFNGGTAHIRREESPRTH